MGNEVLSVQLRFWSSATRDFSLKALEKLTSVTAKETVVKPVGDNDIIIKPRKGKKLFLQTRPVIIGPMLHNVPILSTDKDSAFIFEGFHGVYGLLIPKIVEVKDAKPYDGTENINNAIAHLDPQKRYRLYGEIEPEVKNAKLWIENKNNSNDIAWSIELIITSKMDVIILADRIKHKSNGLVLSCDIDQILKRGAE